MIRVLRRPYFTKQKLIYKQRIRSLSLFQAYGARQCPQYTPNHCWHGVLCDTLTSFKRYHINAWLSIYACKQPTRGAKQCKKFWVSSKQITHSHYCEQKLNTFKSITQSNVWLLAIPCRFQVWDFIFCILYKMVQAMHSGSRSQ